MITILIFIAAIFVLVSILWLISLARQKSTFLEDIGVEASLPLPASASGPKIEAYDEVKEKLRSQYAKEFDNDRWMSEMPAQAKHMVKYRLMQRAIAAMASLKKVDDDMRGYWRLFCKGVITRQYWNSVVAIEREVLLELESVKAEAQLIEPTQDPQGIIQEAMHFIMGYGDKLPSAAEIASSADDMMEMMKSGSPADMAKLMGGMPPPGQHPLMPPGMPSGMRPPGAPGEPAAQQQIGGGDDACKWQQDGDEVEVTIVLPKTATKADVKVVMQPHVLKVLHCGQVLAEGKLGGGCQPEGSTWTMGKGCVVITLEKADARPWPALFKPS